MHFIYRILLLFCVHLMSTNLAFNRSHYILVIEDSQLRHHQSLRVSSRLSWKTIRRRINEENTFEKSTSCIVAQVATCSRSRRRNSCDRFGWAIPCKHALPARAYFAKTMTRRWRDADCDDWIAPYRETLPPSLYNLTNLPHGISSFPEQSL